MVNTVEAKEILQNKITNLLTNRHSRNTQVLQKMELDNSMLEDFVLPLGNKSPIEFDANGSIKMLFNDKEYVMHQNGLIQLAEKFGIPQKYLNYLNETEWGRLLAKNVLTEHKLNINRQRVLVRTVGNEARAVLSDKYRRLNSDQIYESFITESQASGAMIYDAQYNDTKSYISSIIPQVFEVPTENNGTVYSVFGARISNSDFGDGALDVRAFQMNCVCLNGMVSETQLKQIHLGRRLPDNLNFSENTYKLDTRAMASAVKDIMGNVLSKERIMQSAATIKEASRELIDVEKEIKKLPRLGMLKNEVEQVERKLLQGSTDDGIQGKPTRWKLSQAITSVSNDIGGRKKQELDELAGALIKL